MIVAQIGWINAPQRICYRATRLRDHLSVDKFVQLLDRAQRVTQTPETATFLARLRHQFGSTADPSEMFLSEAHHLQLEQAARRGSRGVA